MDYINVILEAIAFMEDHIFETCVYEEVFHHVKISKYHFHRIFLAGTHETVGNYIKKRRFTLIGDRLRQTDDKVIDVAYDCQYESHEAFTRAFKSYFYQTPSQYRKHNRENPFLRKDRIDRGFLEGAKSHFELIPTIKTYEPLLLVGRRAATNFKDNQLGKIWNDFKIYCAKNDMKVSGDYAYTVWLQKKQDIIDLEVQQQYDLFVGFPKVCIDGKATALETFEIDKGLYAIFTMKDSFSFVYKIYSYIYFTWLKKSGYQLGDGYVVETCSKDFSIADEKGEMSIWIPIQKEQ